MKRTRAYRERTAPATWRRRRSDAQRLRLAKTRARWRRMRVLAELERARCRFEGRVQPEHRALAQELDLLDGELVP